MKFSTALIDRALYICLVKALVTSAVLLPVLMFGALIGSFDTEDLRKVPNVLVHYEHHLIEHGEHDLTFLEFLIDHFASDNGPDTEHDDLPIIGGTAGTIIAITSAMEGSVDFDLQPDPVPCSILLSQRITLFGHTTDIFQPPRLG